MRIQWPSRALRRKRMIEKYVSWQLVFLWWPTRTSDDGIEWLTTVARKYSDAYIGKRSGYVYGPSSFALTQPGTAKENPNVAQQPAQQNGQLFVPSLWSAAVAAAAIKGNGVLGAQAGGAAVQGGLGNAALSNGQTVHAQGAAHVGAAAYRGQHTPTP